MIGTVTGAPRHSSWSRVAFDFANAPLDEAVTVYTEMLRYHDWTYEYADDGTEWRRGSDQRSQLLNVRATLTARGANAQALWDEYAR